MSRRSRLATVVRVAELREKVARGQVATAVAAVAGARTEHQQRTAALAGGTLDGQRLASSAAVLELRACAVREASAEVIRADADRLEAVAGQVGAARRARLFGQLADRLRAEDDARRVAADQRTTDDSTSARYDRQAGR